MLLRDGLTNKEIATQLKISEQTAKNHVHNVMRKLGARERMAAMPRCEVELFHSEATGC
jgi:DNA-binding NarL/FixJ family response regulator